MKNIAVNKELVNMGANIVNTMETNGCTFEEAIAMYKPTLTLYDAWQLFNALECLVTNGSSVAMQTSFGNKYPRVVVNEYLVGAISSELERRKFFDEDGTFKANDKNKEHPLGEDSYILIVQLVTLNMRESLTNENGGLEIDWDLFFGSCKVISNVIFNKYKNTDFTEYGISLWEATDLFCEKVGMEYMTTR